MSIPGFSPFPQIPKRSTPEADFDAKMYALFQHFAVTHRNELLAFIEFLETNVTAIEGAINGVSVGLTHPEAAKFTTLAAESIGGAAVQSDLNDATVGRLAKVGAFGWGGHGLVAPDNDLNKAVASGLYVAENATLNRPPVGNTLILHLARTETIFVQVAVKRSTGGGDGMYIRRKHDSEPWTPWSTVLVLDENGNTEQNIGVASDNPRFRIVKADGGFTHELNGNNSSGVMFLNIDKDANGAAPQFIVQVQGYSIASFRPDEILLNRPIVGTITVGGGVSKFGSQANTGSAGVEIGAGRTGNGASYVDLIGDPVHNFGCRLIRNGGENGPTTLSHKGTGTIGIQATDPAIVFLRTDTNGLGRLVAIDTVGHFRPGLDGVQSCGVASLRWSEIFAASGTINTSDARSKTDIQDLDAAERRVAVAAKGLLKKYRMRDAVAEKGDGARWHFGVIAQELAAAFEAEGLDPWRYGVLCWDEWWSAEVEIPAETTPIMEEVEEEVIHMVTVDEPVLDEHGAPTGEVEQVEKEVIELVKKQVETGELEILMEARTELQTFTSAEDAPAGAEYHNRQGVRYDELFAFILAAI